MPSSVIDHFNYDYLTKKLEITFVSGLVYRYLNVPKELYSSLIAARSKGRYFNSCIKDKYGFEKIDT